MQTLAIARVAVDNTAPIVLTLTNRRSGASVSLTCPRVEIPDHVRAFVSDQCLPPSEVSLSVLEQ